MAGVKRFELIEHTADTGLVAYGENLPEAFGNAAYGLFSIIADLRRVKQAESRQFEIEERGPEDLLFEWLNQLVYLFDVEGMLMKKCQVLSLTDRSLKAVCYGEKYDPSRHRLKLAVKSATYHMLEVDKQKNLVRVIFDV